MLEGMHQAAGDNGAPATELGTPLPSVLGDVLLPPPPPRRVCFASPKVVNNPVCSFATPEPLCGQPQRADVLDGVTFEKDLVDCEACQALLSGQKPSESSCTIGTASRPFMPAPPAAAQAGSLAIAPLKALLEQLDPEVLRERLRELDGERAALQVLLEAAIARQKVTDGKPARN